MSSIFLGKPNQATAKWIKEHNPTVGGVWYIVNGQSEGGWATKGDIFSYNASDKKWKLRQEDIAFQRYSLDEQRWQGIRKGDADIAFDQNFNSAKTLTKNGLVVAQWYKSEADIPTWMLGGKWTIKNDDGYSNGPYPISHNDDNHTSWATSKYGVYWLKNTNRWEVDYGGNDGFPTSDMSNPCLRTFRWEIHIGSIHETGTATWSAT